MSQGKLLSQNIHWLESDDQLALHCQSWKNLRILSVDTEFMRSRTYYPIAGLFQLNDGSANYLIDPTTISDWSPLVSLFQNPEIIFVLHSCSEDLEVFYRLFRSLPVNLLDTQVAAAVLGYGFSMGFANLCKEILKVELPKGETRSNWLQRPLSTSQLQYAALDVEYLTRISIFLIKNLQEKGRLGWVKQECDKLKDNFASVQDPQASWKRGKGLWKLDSRRLHFFKKLSYWREIQAQHRDIPRNRVLKDHSMHDLAQLLPECVDDLKRVEGFSERMRRSDGETIINMVEETLQTTENELPERLARPLPSTTKDSAKLLRELVQEKAAEIQVAAEILMRKKEYEELLRSGMNGDTYRLPDSMDDWRKNILQDLLLTKL